MNGMKTEEIDIGMYDIDSIYNHDCIEGMSGLNGGIADLIVTDPPFAIDFKAKRGNYNRDDSNVLEGYNEISSVDYFGFTKRWMEQAYRVLKDSGSMYVFSGWNNLKDILVSLDDVGFTTVNHIIWKYQFGVFTKRKFVSSHYHCLYVCKNDAMRKFFPYSRYGKDDTDMNGGKLHYQDKEDVWVIKREYWRGEKKTPTKLPSEVIRKILLYSSEENDIVLDPFLGSGQVAVVSNGMKRRYIGFEIVKDYHEFANDRLAETSIDGNNSVNGNLSIY